MTDKDAGAPGPAAKRGVFSRNKTEKPPRDTELDVLMSEIESDLREDELKRIWKRYGVHFIVVAVLFVTAVAGYEGWRAYQTRAHAEVAARYEAALGAARAQRLEDAQAQLKAVAGTSDRAYAALARLSDAVVSLQRGDVPGAVASYDALAADANVDPIFRDLAVVLRVLHSLDRDDPKMLEARLAPLVESQSAFRYSALELTAMLAAKQNDLARAAAAADRLAKDEGAPVSMRGRAQELAALFASGTAPAPVAPVPAPPPTNTPAAPAPAATTPGTRP